MVMSFSERRYIDQIIHLFAVPQYLGLVVWLLSIYKQTIQSQIWGTVLRQYLYRLEENYMTEK
ncbi:hypothetical protein DRH13_02550 [Candidatus Woesebacteria bacterium]|jgi:hypothetical protein|nr:MAG: hypothetical protein DRH13_02550 [Candidatus Woesebacteria bacterium]